jgi:hypothetical protein
MPARSDSTSPTYCQVPRPMTGKWMPVSPSSRLSTSLRMHETDLSKLPNSRGSKRGIKFLGCRFL